MTLSKRIFIAMLAIAFIFSITVNFWLLTKLFKAHSQITALYLNPTQTSLERQKRIFSGDLLIFGDSLAAQWNPMPSVNSVLNFGIEGQTTPQLLLRAHQELNLIDVKWSVLLSGGNDIKAVASFPERADRIVSDSLANIQAILAEMPGKYKIIATTPPLFNLPFRYRLLDYKAALKAQEKLNNGIRELANDEIRVLDLFQLFQGVRNRKLYSDDGVHMNSLAYELVNRELMGVLESFD